jgi:hypothetical protein
MSTLLMETLTPLTLEVALAVQHELQQRLAWIPTVPEFANK